MQDFVPRVISNFKIDILYTTSPFLDLDFLLANCFSLEDEKPTRDKGSRQVAKPRKTQSAEQTKPMQAKPRGGPLTFTDPSMDKDGDSPKPPYDFSGVVQDGMNARR